MRGASRKPTSNLSRALHGSGHFSRFLTVRGESGHRSDPGWVLALHIRPDPTRPVGYRKALDPREKPCSVFYLQALFRCGARVGARAIPQTSTKRKQTPSSQSTLTRSCLFFHQSCVLRIVLHLDSGVVVAGTHALYPQLLPQVEPPRQAVPRNFVSAIPSPPSYSTGIGGAQCSRGRAGQNHDDGLS